MTTPPATQRTDIQADLGIGSDEAVFTHDELDRLYDRASSNYELSVAYAIRQILMIAAKFNDYTAGYTAEKKSQVFQQLRGMYEVWLRVAGGAATPLTASTIEQDFIEPHSSASEYT